MESFLIYILKASALLGIFYLSYLLLLKKETSFQLNRKFLLAGILSSLILPLIYLTKKVYIEATPTTFNYFPGTVAASETPMEASLDWWQISGTIYLVITVFFLFRFCLQISAVMKIIFLNNIQKDSGFKYLKVTEDQLPFSFFSFIVYNPFKHSEKDLKLILEHEKVHARQLHSADIILVNLMSCFLWFNPFAWFYKKSVEQNLEYIADRETVSNTAEIKEYQHALVKVSIADLRPALTNHFYQSFIKKRILMLNKKSSNQSPAWKLSLIMPVLLAFMLLFNVKTEAQVVSQKETEKSPEIVELTEASEDMDIEVEEVTESEEVQELEESIEIIAEEEPGEVYFIRLKKDEKKDPLKMLGSNPLYLINGKEYRASRLENKYIALKSGLNFLDKADATKRFGKKGENGAVIIPDAEIIRNFNKELKEIEGHKFSGRYIMIGENGKPNYIRLNSSNSAPKHQKIKLGKGHSTVRVFPRKSDYELLHGSSSRGINGRGLYEFKTTNREISGNNVRIRKINKDSNKVFSQKQDEEPIYVVNDEIQNKEFINLIEPEDIASINVLKGGMAIKEYGKKAKNGVIVIKTKVFTGESDASLFLIKNTFTSDQIEALKKEVSEKTDYNLELTDIKRNEQGIITNIGVKFYNSRSMVNSTYNNEDGVPNISFGLKSGGGLIISASE